MSEVLYAVPDFTKKVRFKQDNKEEEKTEAVYDNTDSVGIYENRCVEGVEPPKLQDSAEDQQQIISVPVNPEKRSSFRAASVFLGLLCLLLLAATIALGVQHIQDKSNWNLEKHRLQVDNNNLTRERNQLQTSYDNLTRERDQLQTSYDNLTRERDQLQTSYDIVAEESSELKSINRNLTREMVDLRATNNNLTKERDELKKQVCDTACCPNQWRKFGCACYFVSTSKKNWEESRDDCALKRASLVIISSEEEQRFIIGLNKNAWIGLTDEENEGTWKWVDGTSLTTSYWHYPQPDNHGENGEDCVETAYSEPNLKTWNDLNCNERRIWICEKRIH